MLPAGWQPKRHLAGFPFVSSFVNKSERVSSEVIPAETERAGSRGHDHRHSLPLTVLPILQDSDPCQLRKMNRKRYCGDSSSLISSSSSSSLNQVCVPKATVLPSLKSTPLKCIQSAAFSFIASSFQSYHCWRRPQFSIAPRKAEKGCRLAHPPIL